MTQAHDQAHDDGWWWQFGVSVRNAVLAEYGPRSCVETTRAAIVVGKYFGEQIDPVPVLFSIHTRENWQAPQDVQVGWSVGVHASVAGRLRPELNRWDGHLLGHARAGVLLDLSAEQFDRPEKGLRVPGPIILAMSREKLAQGAAVEDHVNDTFYQVVEHDDQSWRAFPAWTARPAVIRRIAGVAIRELRDIPAIH